MVKAKWKSKQRLNYFSSEEDSNKIESELDSDSSSVDRNELERKDSNVNDALKHNNTNEKESKKNLDFSQRRELRKKAAGDKRRSKMKCHICGGKGHVKRECPGVSDDGKGNSKYTKSKGDAGALVLKSTTKGSKSKGRKQHAQVEEDVKLILPAGFSIMTNKKSEAGIIDENELKNESFQYFDVGSDGFSTIDYLRTCSGRAKNSKNISTKEAALSFQIVMDKVISTSNYGGCISRSLLKKNRTWKASEAYPLQLDKNKKLWFAVGLGSDFQYENDINIETGSNPLVKTVSESSDFILAVFSDLDYSQNTISKFGNDKESQLYRLRCTCRAANQIGCPVQIRIYPSPSINQRLSREGEEARSGLSCQYSKVMIDLAKVLLEVITLYPELKVHLSCWSGKAEHMTSLLNSFPDNIWIGFDGSVSFGKAKHIHECAFDVPLSKILLETGSMNNIPAKVVKVMGNAAFCHPGLIPYVAESLAEHKKSLLDITGERIARCASENTLSLYHLPIKG